VNGLLIQTDSQHEAGSITDKLEKVLRGMLDTTCHITSSCEFFITLYLNQCASKFDAVIVQTWPPLNIRKQFFCLFFFIAQ